MYSTVYHKNSAECESSLKLDFQELFRFLREDKSINLQYARTNSATSLRLEIDENPHHQSIIYPIESGLYTNITIMNV